MVLNQPNALPSPIGTAASPATCEGSGSSSRGPTTPFKPIHNFPLHDLRWPMSQSRNNRTSPPDTVVPPAPVVKEAESKKPGKILIRLILTKVTDEGASAAEVVVAPPPSPPRPPVPAGDDVEGDEADDDEMMVADVGGEEDNDDEEEGLVEPKTWNLRPRKAVTKPPPGAGQVGPKGGKGGGEAKKKVKVIEKEKEIEREKKEKAKEEKRERERVRREKLKEQRRNNYRRDRQEEMVGVPSFSLSLTKDQIELDFLAMTGSKLPRRPKRRPTHIQKQLDNVFPGLWLDSITPDTYKVDEPEPKPRI